MHTAMSISLIWNQPPASVDAVDSYEINYNFTVNECSGSTRSNSFPVTVIVDDIDDTARGYTLTPVEEDSTYSIHLSALNSVTRSAPTPIIMTITNRAGT